MCLKSTQVLSMMTHHSLESINTESKESGHFTFVIIRMSYSNNPFTLLDYVLVKKMFTDGESFMSDGECLLSHFEKNSSFSLVQSNLGEYDL